MIIRLLCGRRKRHLREFDIEELLFRKPLVVSDEHTMNIQRQSCFDYRWWRFHWIGAVSSVGKDATEQIVILDIYENGAYDVQQELINCIWKYFKSSD